MTSEALPDMRSLGWRIPASILAGVGWLAFVIIWLFFFASDHSIYRNIGVLFVSVLITMLFMVVVWVGFGLRMGEMYAADRPEWKDMRQIRWRVVVNSLIVAAWAVFFLIWLFVYADSFSGYQNIAVVIVSLIVAAGLSAALWAKWWSH